MVVLPPTAGGKFVPRLLRNSYPFASASFFRTTQPARKAQQMRGSVKREPANRSRTRKQVIRYG